MTSHLAYTRVLCGVCLLLVVGVITTVLVARSQRLHVLEQESLVVNGDRREFRLAIPAGINRPVPVIFAFGGVGDHPASIAAYSHLDELAAERGCLIVYPAASNSLWSGTVSAGHLESTNPDLQFFDMLLAHLDQQFPVDHDRVYAVGMSNGGSFVQRLAVERSDELAAAVSFAGPKPKDLAGSSAGCPLLLLVGDRDLARSTLEQQATTESDAGRAIAIHVFDNLGHQWAPGANRRIWRFFSDHANH